jgi:hypothetical protein
MNARTIAALSLTTLFFVGGAWLLLNRGERAAASTGDATDIPELGMTRLERGKYLVTSVGCDDCHTPLKMGPNGPAPDMSRRLSGHPDFMKLPPAPPAAGPWNVSAAATLTAWSGPWGTSFTANLTPDRETGLGSWTEQNFVQAIRKGRHMGSGRPLLPPMPAAFYANFSDEDLKAIFAYLKSIPAIRNRVPQPLPPIASAQ